MELRYKDTAGIEEKEIVKTAKKLEPYIAHLIKVSKESGYNSFEEVINLSFDSEIQKEIKDLVGKKDNNKLKYIIVLGIGGSNLGAVAVYEAIYGKLDAFLKNRFPKIIFLDAISPKSLKTAEEILNEISDSSEIIINVISKSGTTFETVTNFDALYNFLKTRFPNINERIIAITDFQSPLWQRGEKEKFSLLEIPKNIIGRYSIFSAGAVFPLVLSRLNIEKLLEGGRLMRDKCISPEISSNPALISAVLIYLYYKKGVLINNTFFSNPELEALGRWYRQLLAESIGKNSQGITPIISVPADLHSMLQLYLDGPGDKFTVFVYTSAMEIILRGAKNSYKNKGIPFMEIVLPEVSEFFLGEYMQFKMIETMFLAKLLNANPFDQPAVDAYKKDAEHS